MSPEWGILLLIFHGWLFSWLLTYFLNYWKIPSSWEFVAFDSSKLLVRTINEVFSTVFIRMLIFKQSSTTCSIFSLLFFFFLLFFAFSLNFYSKYPPDIPRDLRLSMWSLFSLVFSTGNWNCETFSHLIFLQWNDSHRLSLSFHYLYCHQYGINQLETIKMPVSARHSAVITLSIHFRGNHWNCAI